MFYFPTFVAAVPTVECVLIDFFGKGNNLVCEYKMCVVVS